MSHFTVLVIGDNVDEQLAPYHEFESTGEDDQYVQDIDVTEEYREQFNKYTSTKLQAPDGSYHSPYDEQFYRDPTPEELARLEKRDTDGLSYRQSNGKYSIQFIPEGYQKVEVPYNQLMTFAEYAQDDGKDIVPFGKKLDKKEKHKYGYTLVDEKGEVIKVVDRTNPNCKWDWYSVGGRWTGFFKLKAGAPGLRGRPGLMTEMAGEGYADSAKIKDIDFEAIMQEKGDEARKRYQMLAKAFGGEIPKLDYTWEEVGEGLEFHDLSIEEKRQKYWEQPANLKLKEVRKAYWDSKKEKGPDHNIDMEFVIWTGIEEFQCTEELYVTRARESAFETFAVVKDGKWYEKGEMGWFAMVSNEKDPREWNKQFTSLLQGLDPETTLTLIDCHI